MKLCKKILIINGPNLNLLGQREPKLYGKTTYQELVKTLKVKFKHIAKLKFIQTNYEGQIIDYLHKANANKYNGIILNAGGYSHTSVAIHDAIKGISPQIVVCVHLTNIYEREAFRHVDVVGQACQITFYGEGIISYKKAINYLLTLERTRS